MRNRILLPFSFLLLVACGSAAEKTVDAEGPALKGESQEKTFIEVCSVADEELLSNLKAPLAEQGFALSPQGAHFAYKYVKDLTEIQRKTFFNVYLELLQAQGETLGSFELFKEAYNHYKSTFGIDN